MSKRNYLLGAHCRISLSVPDAIVQLALYSVGPGDRKCLLGAWRQCGAEAMR